MKKIVFYVFLFIVLTGCATVLSGTSQIISLQAVDADTNEPLDDVTCHIRDGNGVLYLVISNPGSVSINKGSGALIPECKKEGYKQKSFASGDSFDALTLINILFWPGFIVDAVSGSIKKYPSHIAVLMEPKPIQQKESITQQKRSKTGFEVALEALKTLREQGVITEEEYKEKVLKLAE